MTLMNINHSMWMQAREGIVLSNTQVNP